MATVEKRGSEEAGNSDIQIGFVEATQPWKLISRYFPTKVGGRPAWLELERLPSPETMLCVHCGNPYVFLCQIYAPVEGKSSAFHRTVFVFICKTPACSQKPQGGVLALRSQLARENPQYPATPQEEMPVVGEDQYSASHYLRLCAVCGCHGPKQCAGCKRVHYCSRQHQALDWKRGHKKLCRDGGTAGGGSGHFLLPEFEVVTEDEPEDPKDAEKSEEDRMAEYNSLKLKEKIESLPDADVSELDRLAASDGADDAAFARFRKRVAREPEQVVRYWRGGEPLWVSSVRQPGADDLPHCHCGAPRHFEFQILPQMLNHLDLDETGDSVDWGTLAVFTCSDSCDPAGDLRYQPELVWKQQL